MVRPRTAGRKSHERGVIVRVWFGLCVVCVLLSACGRPDSPPERVAATESRLYMGRTIDTRRAFEEALVGQALHGDGVEVTVAPNGRLVGQRLGRPFVGSWEYSDETLCVSLTSPDIRRADDRRCFHAALLGDDVILVPAEAS